MNFGFNSNVRVGEAMYHVQTEDRGPVHPFLDTVVYMAGRVVYKRSTSYEKFAEGMEAAVLTQKLREQLSQQHREVIAGLEGGSLALQSTEKKELAPENPGKGEGLELLLLNPKSCFAAGSVTLEIELRGENSKKGIGGAEVEAFLEHEKQRVTCGEARTDAKGSATLMFPTPTDMAEGSTLVVRASDGTRFGTLRFRMKSKPAPVSR